MNRLLISILRCGQCGLLLSLLFANLPTPVAAQKDKRPSDAMKQLGNQQRKLMENLERDLETGKAPPTQSDDLGETIRQQAAQRAAQFNLADWKENELIALGELYERAEDYAPAAEAFRRYLQGKTNPDFVTFVKSKLIKALIETEQLAEAAQQLAEFKREPARSLRDTLALRTTLYKELAFAYRDRADFAQALKYAQQAFDLADVPPFARNAPARETLTDELVSIMPLIVAQFERESKNKEAEQLQDRLKRNLFKTHPQLKDTFDHELALNRLYGKPAPELSANRWLNGPPLKLSDLRGKVVLLDFWAMWCAPCLKAFPYLREWQSKYADKGLAIIGVTRFYGRSNESDNLNREQEWEALQAFQRKQQLSWPLAVGKMDDPTNDERFGVLGLPVAILLDRRGNVREIHRGAINQRKLAQHVARLVDEK